MNGMRMPGVSAGSNQAAGKPTWTAQVSWPSGDAAAGARMPARTARKSTRSPSKRFMIGVLSEIVPSWRLRATRRKLNASRWDREREGRAHAQLTRDPDPAAVEFDELPTERQP